MNNKLSRTKLKLGRIKEGMNKMLGDSRKLNTAKDIRSILTDKEYNTWINKLSKAMSPEEQEQITAEYFKSINKYDKLNDIVRII